VVIGLVSFSTLFINAAISLTEPFPVGLIITLISAAILRKKAKAQSDSQSRDLEA
jgi:hypothetical protein